MCKVWNDVPDEHTGLQLSVNTEKRPMWFTEMQTIPEAGGDEWRRGCKGLPGAGAHLR